MDDRTARHQASPAGASPRWLAVMLTAALALAQTGCGSSGSTPPAPTCTVTGVSVSASPATIPSGGTTALSATLDASAPCATGLTWSVSPPGGTLTPNGASATFTSTAANTYTITAASVADPTKVGSVAVTVSPPVTCTVTGVTVSASLATIPSGGTTALSATLDASAACATGLTWSVTPTGGTLTPSGASATFTSTAANTYTITAASVADPTKVGSVAVTVSPPVTCTITGVTVSASPASVPAGAPSTVSAAVDATGPCSRAVTWEASGGTLSPSGATATFSSNSAGTFSVKATSVEDPTKFASADVLVTAPVTCVVSAVVVSASHGTIPSGGTSALGATVLSTGSCSGAVDWSVLPAGGTLTPNGASATFTSTVANTYTITATSVDDIGKSGSATVTVDPAVTCTVTGLALNASPATIAPGTTSTLTATLTASAGCNHALNWAVSPGGGTLTPNGDTATFTSTVANIYTITATSVADTSKSASATVTVLPACTVTGVAVTASPPTIPSGGTSALSAILTASPSCSTALTWSVTPGSGTLTPNGATATFTSTVASTYTITATSVADTSKSGSATVTVSPAATCTVTGVTVTASPPTIPSGGTATLTTALNATAGCNTGLTWTVEPTTGGTLTPSGNSATFTSTTQATFTIRATSVADTSKSGSATVTVGPPVACGQPNGTFVEHRGAIRASETWAGDGVTHLVPASVEIYGTAVVTIEPCAIVTLRANVNITAFESATLLSAGTGGNRFVTFSASGTLLRWGTLRAFGPNALIDLRWTNLNEGGEQDALFGSMLAGLGAGYGAPPSPNLRVQHVEIAGSGGIGVFVDQNATFTADSVDLIVKDCASYPVRASLLAVGTLPTGLYVQNARKDGADEIVVYGFAEASADMTIRNLGVPYRVEVPFVTVRPKAPATAPVTLTIEPGVTMKFPRLPGSAGTLVTLGDPAANTVGTLTALGTALDPIAFTSGEAVPGAGDWAGVWLANAAGSRLDHVDLSFAGAPNGITADNCRPAGTSTAAALIVGANSAQYVPPADLLTNSTVTASAGFGINAIWQAATVNAPLLDASNTFSGNLRCSQTFNGLTGGAACPALGCSVP